MQRRVTTPLCDVGCPTSANSPRRHENCKQQRTQCYAQKRLQTYLQPCAANSSCCDARAAQRSAAARRRLSKQWLRALLPRAQSELPTRELLRLCTLNQISARVSRPRALPYVAAATRCAIQYHEQRSRQASAAKRAAALSARNGRWQTHAALHTTTASSTRNMAARVTSHLCVRRWAHCVRHRCSARGTLQ